MFFPYRKLLILQIMDYWKVLQNTENKFLTTGDKYENVGMYASYAIIKDFGVISFDSIWVSHEFWLAPAQVTFLAAMWPIFKVLGLRAWDMQ